MATSDYGQNGSADVYWWVHEPSDEAQVLQSLCADFQLCTGQNARLEAYETYAALYTNRRVDRGSGLLAAYGEANWAIDKGKYTRCPYNLMKQVIDEVQARIIKSHPKAKFLTYAGDWEKQQQAELMERWNDGIVYQMYQDEVLTGVIGDACLFGLGALYTGKAPKENRIDSRQVWPGNLFVDLQETRRNKPTRLHNRRFVSKSVLKMYFPDMKSEIEASGTVSDHYQSFESFDQIVDVVEVVESWHLPSFKGATDGRYYMWVSNTLLQSHAYTRRSFPFAFFTWKRDPNNRFYGIGLGEDLFGVHIDANVTLNRVNTAVEFASVPHWVYRQASVTESDITNMPGSRIPFTGDVAPQYIVPNSIPQDLLMYVREHEARAYKIAGLGSAQAFGDRVPSGLETGRAVENFFQVESVPFAEQLQKFQYFVVDVANANVAAGHEIYETAGNKWDVLVPGEKNTIERLDWSKVAIDPREDSYIIRATPASVLSETFGARLGEVERISAQFPEMTSAQKWELLGMPDIERAQDVATAAMDNGMQMILMALRDNEYTPPSPFMDLNQFIIDANREEQMAMRMKLPEQNIATLRRMMRRANELEQKKQLATMMQNQGVITPAAVPNDGSGQSTTANIPQGQANGT